MVRWFPGTRCPGCGIKYGIIIIITMALLVSPYTGKDEAAFDAFVASSRNGTILHTRKFLAYHPKDRFHDASLIIRDGETMVGVFPAAIKEEKGKKMLVSHPGASYGGLVIGKDASVQETGEMLAAIKDYAKEQGFSGISLLRLPPASLQKQYSEDQLYWAFQSGFRMTRCEMDGAIDLVGLKSDQILESLSGKCRNMVRQAERAKITVRLTDDFASFWPILESVLTGRHGAKPTHTLAEIQTLHELLPQGFRLLAAFDGKKMVGGIVLVTIHEKALYTLYMGQEYASQQHHPMHLLLAEAIKLALKEGRRVLHLGVSTEDGGTKINEGLFFFKESFGCRPVRRESWEIIF